MNVICYINVIVKIDEVIMTYLPENSKYDNSKNEINNQFLSVGADIYFISHGDLPEMLIPQVNFKFSNF